LGERHFLREGGELILMDEGSFSEAPQPVSLEQAGALAAEARPI
jgi:hypothetical protein